MADFSRSEYFDRVNGRADVDLLETKRIVVIGVGSVGSQVAKELANCGVGNFVLVDGEALETGNLPRHALDSPYLGWNKAEGMADDLKEVPGVRVESVPRHVDQAMPDQELDALVQSADLVVAATDRLEIQWRIGQRALVADRHAIFPGVAPDGDGEVFVQLGPTLPCYRCYSGFRSPEDDLRGVNALNADFLAVVQRSVHLSLGLLDSQSAFTRVLMTEAGQRRPQLFTYDALGGIGAAMPAEWRPDCPSCAGLRQPSTTPAPLAAPLPRATSDPWGPSEIFGGFLIVMCVWVFVAVVVGIATIPIFYAAGLYETISAPVYAISIYGLAAVLMTGVFLWVRRGP